MTPTRRRTLAALGAAALSAAVPAARAAYSLRPWPAGKATPALDLRDLDGRRWTLADLRGQATVMNFWASWCEPCAVEMPTLSWLAEQPDGPRVLGVNYQEHDDKIRRFMQQVPIAFPVLVDRTGEAARAWTPRVFPSTVVIEADGRPAFTVVGEFNWAGPEAERLLQPLLRRKPSGS